MADCFLGLITHIKAFHPAQYSEFLSNKKTGKDKSTEKRNTEVGKQELIQEIILSSIKYIYTVYLQVFRYIFCQTFLIEIFFTPKKKIPKIE